MSDSLPISGLVGVRTRISWASIFAGAFVSLVALLVLSALGTAVGVTATQGEVPDGMASGIWSIVAAMLSLFLGGWTASQFVVRETRREAVVYGIVLWGLLYVSLLVFGYFGVVTTFNAVMGIGGPTSLPAIQLSEIARQMGLTPEQIALLDEALREAYVATSPVASAWWTLAGIVCSLAAATLGSFLGNDRRPALAASLRVRRRIEST